MCRATSSLTDQLGPSIAKTSKLVAQAFWQRVLVRALPGLPEAVQGSIPLQLLSLWGEGVAPS